MEDNAKIVEKEATGHSTRMRNSFIENTYIPKSQRKTILLLSDDL
jgi:hypothetical protein